MMALPSQQEHHQAQPVLVAALHLLAVLLQEACVKCSVQHQFQIMELLSSVDFIGLLLNSVLANTRVPRASHYSAAACLCELVRMLDSIVSFHCSVRCPDGGAPQGTEPCTESLQQALCALLQHVIRQIGMPAQHYESGTFVGRHMLRMGMQMLQHICRIVPGEQWSQCVLTSCPCMISQLLCLASFATIAGLRQADIFMSWCRAWVSAVGIVWLTKQVKSLDLHVRCQAVQLLSILAHPSSLQMRNTLLQAWPEGGTLMMRHGLSRRQPPAFSAAALTFTATSMASSTMDVPVPENPKASC
jgi:hypothetical protein